LSQLQISLIGLAALALLVLYLGEKWQEHRRLRRLRERLHGGVGDALLQTPAMAPAAARAVPGGAAGAARFEPFLPGAPVPAAPSPPASAAQEPDDAQPADEAAPPRAFEPVHSEPLATPVALLRPDWAEDPLLDCSLELRCARAVDGVSVIDAAAALGHGDWKLPVHFVVWDGRHQQWVLPDRFGYYTDALASIQLADRRACIDEAELGRFVQVVRQMAQTLGADVDPPDPVRLVAQARALDQLCARFDIRIGLTVEAGGPAWTGPQLRNAAHEAGFTALQAQRWTLRDEQDLDLVSLQADSSGARLSLELDIALAPVAAQPFAVMVDRAGALAALLGGRVVDDNGRPIDPQSVQAIEQQLAQVYEQLRAEGIEPGSTRARRLYASPA
jgi:hypothetical protein